MSALIVNNARPRNRPFILASNQAQDQNFPQIHLERELVDNYN